MTAPVYACARCGFYERFGDTFLCERCLADPHRLVQQRTAEQLHPGNHTDQRRLLIDTYKWQGWNRRMKAADRA